MSRSTAAIIRCGSLRVGAPHVPHLGCGVKLSWDRATSGEWKRGVGDPLVAIRCLECGAILCVTCAHTHFALRITHASVEEELLLWGTADNGRDWEYPPDPENPVEVPVCGRCATSATPSTKR